LETELYIFQRADVKNAERWFCSYKLNGIKRIYKALGVMSQESAAKLARRELTSAEEKFELYGATAVLGKNKISDALKFFKDHGQNLVSETRYQQILGDWNNHLYRFFGANTAIDKRLQKRMSSYVEYRRRVVHRGTGKRLQAAASTLKLEIVSAKQLLKIARESGGIGDDVGNLTIGIKKSKLQQGKSSSTTFADAEVDQINAFFDADAEELSEMIGGQSHSSRTAQRNLYLLERLRFFVALAFSTGARVNELRQVRHADFTVDSGGEFKTLRIRKSKTKAGTNRNAYIDDEIWSIRAAYARYGKHCKTSKPNSLVFAENEGNLAEQQARVLLNVGNSFTAFLKKHRMVYEKTHGKRRRNFFATRHYFISKCVNDGVLAFDVAQTAGTSVAQIERTYYENDAATTVKNIERQKTTKRRSSLRVVK
jgi:integrase